MTAELQAQATASDQLMANMTRVFRALKAIMREEADRQGLSMTQLIALRVLDTRGSMTMSELRDCLDITQGAATTVVDKLLARGLVARVADPSDRRLVLVRNTDAGRDLMESVLKASQIHVDRVLAVLTPDEYGEVVRGFAHFARALDKDASGLELEGVTVCRG